MTDPRTAMGDKTVNAPDSVEKVVGELRVAADATAAMGMSGARGKAYLDGLADRLAALGGEPVAWGVVYDGKVRDATTNRKRAESMEGDEPRDGRAIGHAYLVPLYTTPPALPALTDEEREALEWAEKRCEMDRFALTKIAGSKLRADTTYVETLCAALRRCYPKAGGG
jgi:hypothetical protein